MTPPAMRPDAPMEWWKTGVLYQIYPRSFQDGNGDGVGDLPGILRRADYFSWLGVDAVWLSPVFPSPMADFGYDVADYCAIDPVFGTMEDFEALRDALHRRGIKLILDLVPNHSSESHPWFVASRSSRDDPKRAWYLWADPGPDGGPPNNWLSVFGGSAWELDPGTGQYYCHAFLREQPDLNWRNPEVRRAIYDVMRFWLDRGADGFRVDVMWHLIKDELLRDNPRNPDHDPERDPGYQALLPVHDADQPEVHEIVAEMRAVVDEYEDRLLIGEIYLPVPRLVRYYGRAGEGAHLPFNFQLVLLPWEARRIEAAIEEYEGALPRDAWPNWVLGNHDKDRVASRFGAAAARAAAVLLLTLRGTPTLYYGDELGLRNGEIPPQRVRDPQALRDPASPTRDAFRCPMPWEEGPHAGFSDAPPWLPIGDGDRERNVARQRAEPGSMLQHHRRLLELRRASRALTEGRYLPLPGGDDLLGYVREHGDERVLVVVNFAAEPRTWRPRRDVHGVVVLSTHDRRGPFAPGAALQGDEAVVVRVEDAERTA